MSLPNINNLFEALLKTEIEYQHLNGINNLWPEERRTKYNFGVLLGKYLEKDSMLFDFLRYQYSNEEITTTIIENINYLIKQIKQQKNIDFLNECKVDMLTNQLDLLTSKKLEEWLATYYQPIYKMEPYSIEDCHIKTFCYIDYAYTNYCNKLKSVYNSDTNNIKTIYAGIYEKESQLYKYGLIEIDDNCEIMPLDPPRIFDSKINKTFYLINVTKELLEVFESNINLLGRISLRVSNLQLYIFDGKYTMQKLTESLEFGKKFSVSEVGIIPTTKLYSTNYNDTLWVKIDSSNITFEELCENKYIYGDSIITQVIHLEYKNIESKLIITHIDHEFVFYSREDYSQRQTNSNIKGTEQKRLKSFKIDNANIPIDLSCERNINVIDDSLDGYKKATEKVPFLILVLKTYFKHTDLIDEYFESLYKK